MVEHLKSKSTQRNYPTGWMDPTVIVRDSHNPLTTMSWQCRSLKDRSLTCIWGWRPCWRGRPCRWPRWTSWRWARSCWSGRCRTARTRRAASRRCAPGRCDPSWWPMDRSEGVVTRVFSRVLGLSKKSGLFASFSLVFFNMCVSWARLLGAILQSAI